LRCRLGQVKKANKIILIILTALLSRGPVS
jgi:hypothetical protein